MRSAAALLIALLILYIAPLPGIYLSGDAMADYLSFPPVTTSVSIGHAPFSITAFFLYIFLILITITPFIIKVITSRDRISANPPSSRVFPTWGLAGLLIMSAGWLLAWTRFEWFSRWQTHSFILPWIGYIILVNAITFKRTGRSMITHEPVYFAALFIVSAAFWWYFEYLNRFVQNWYYVNVQTTSPLGFFTYATPPFATVLPAVTGTFHLLRSYPSVSRGLDHFIGIPVANPKMKAVTAILIASALLMALPVWPGYFFPALWISPLVIIGALVALAGIPSFLNGITGGNWKAVYLLALSALICGFFWEMWNYYSYTRWEYSVPFLNGFRLFEMPLPGYAGYLPFGVICGLVSMLVRRMTAPSRDITLP